MGGQGRLIGGLSLVFVGILGVGLATGLPMWRESSSVGSNIVSAQTVRSNNYHFHMYFLFFYLETVIHSDVQFNHCPSRSSITSSISIVISIRICYFVPGRQRHFVTKHMLHAGPTGGSAPLRHHLIVHVSNPPPRSGTACGWPVWSSPRARCSVRNRRASPTPPTCRRGGPSRFCPSSWASSASSSPSWEGAWPTAAALRPMTITPAVSLLQRPPRTRSGPVCLSVCLSVCLQYSVCLAVSLSALQYLSVWLSICLSV